MKHKPSLRRALPIVVAAVLLTATLVDVVAAGVKAVSGRSRPAYPAAGGTISVSVPDAMRNTMRSFPPELLPQ
jgi:hypothetical protein